MKIPEEEVNMLLVLEGAHEIWRWGEKFFRICCKEQILKNIGSVYLFICLENFKNTE